MSVMLVDDETYKKVANSLIFGSNNYIVKQIVQRYSVKGVIGQVKKLYEANHLSYQRSYKIQYPIAELEIKETERKTCKNLCQLLKSLRCIKYQIELDEKEFDSKFLEYSIKVITDAIIEGLPEFENAIWG